MYKYVYLHPGDHSIEKEQDDDITKKGNNVQVIVANVHVQRQPRFTNCILWVKVQSW